MGHFPKSILIISVGMVLAAGVWGCPKKPTETATQSVSPSQPQGQPSLPPSTETAPPSERHPVTEETVKPGENVPPGGMAKPAEKAEELKDIFFDFDKATISSDMKGDLDRDAAWLKSNSQIKIQLEGHCDERGTNEYNLALGERRAHSVKQFLIAEGVKASRISTISYGEDRPFCKEQTESCYKQNRRVHFVLK